MKQIIQTDGAPAAIGPYSQGVQAGNLIFISGQLPIDPDTGALVAGDVGAQTTRAIQNIAAVLAARGAALSDVVKTTVYLQRMDDFAVMNAAYAALFTRDCPARAAVEVARLPKDALVEIEAVAYLPHQTVAL